MANTKLKPLYLLDIFREMTDERHRMTVPELLEELQRRGITAERKGIYRDIDALIQYGADIKHTGTGYYLARGELSRDELKCLIWALRSAIFLSDKRTAALLEKLKGIVGMQLAALTLPEDGAMKCQDDQMIENIDRLSVAIEQRRQVTYSDKDHMDGLARRLRISPYALLWLKKGCCVLCNQEGQSGLSCLKLANMSSIRTDMTPWRNYSEISMYRELDLDDIAARLEAGEDICKP